MVTDSTSHFFQSRLVEPVRISTIAIGNSHILFLFSIIQDGLIIRYDSFHWSQFETEPVSVDRYPMGQN